MQNETAKKPEQPYFDVTWFRFPNHPAASLQTAFTQPKAFGVYGVGTGEGKSTIIENIGNHYATVIDAFGSRDNEGLAWLRSHRKDGALLLHGDDVKVKCNYELMSISEFKATPVEDFGKYSVIISAAAFYTDIYSERHALTRIVDKLWERTHWDIPWCLMFREAANILYSRESLGDNQLKAKNYMIYVFREMRHCGFALAFDSVRWYSIDIDVRTLADYTFLKGQGIEGLPKGLQFLYHYFDPYGLMQMNVEKFALYTKKGSLACGYSTLPYWHKKEREDMLDLFNIEIEKGMPIDYGRQSSHMGDFGHLKIIQTRAEKRNDDGTKWSFAKVANACGISSKTAYSHVLKHNQVVGATGECDKCTRVNSPYKNKIVI